ncbi:MAG: PorT family protein [Bacteroidetes bacterium]|jgi:hypothetical protein|nr:PorT family protein [Bacteroidota bacterium]
MKNLIQYLKLWQKKRDELQVDTDAGSDWLGMSKLLDEHMPANDNSGGSSPKKGISLFSMMLITLSAAAMFYVAHTVIESKKKTAYHKHRLHHKKHGSASGTDSLAIYDSLQQSEDQMLNRDSASVSQDASTTATASDNGANKKNGREQVKTNSVNNKISPAQANSNKRQKIVDVQNSGTSANLSHLPDNKKLSLPAYIKEKASSEQPIRLSSNSLTKPYDHKKPHSLTTEGNERNHSTGRSSGNTPDPFSGNDNLSNTNNSSAQTNLNSTLHTQQYNQRNLELLPSPGNISIATDQSLINAYSILSNKPLFQASIDDVSKTRKSKNKSPLHIDLSDWDWGILIGANSNGSFTSGNLNKNFYGSLPVDVFPGIYATYNLNTKWGIGAQVTLLNPQVAKGGTYDRPYFFSYTDSNAVIKHKLITDSKKIYSVQVPLYATYKVANNINLKAGPVISFPLKQYNITTQVDSISQDIINHSRYDQKIDFGFAGGASYQYKRLIFEVNYLKGLKHHNIVSDSLIHRSTNNTFQFSIKLQLGGNKK